MINIASSVEVPSVAELALLRSALNEAHDERPIQTFLAAHPHLMACLLPPGRGMSWFDRPRFGSEFIPDFLLSTENSTGAQWRMVELESPTSSPLTRAGMPSQKLNQAITQIRDWRAWLRQNIAYAQNQLEFHGLDAECGAFVVIGRRHGIETRHAARYRALSDDRTTVMTYDRLLDAMARGRRLMEENDGER